MLDKWHLDVALGLQPTYVPSMTVKYRLTAMIIDCADPVFYRLKQPNLNCPKEYFM